ncbi:NAD(P)/FAD-dependent oxidoreductase [Curvivirga aplysinae]|uniref:NAD(P)/FAD-dependent oxidoreductase n=1 Tax=Curvivirga aplysinae TaxID=2529852 RepID=UPI0012BBA8B5|nr:FAD-dependent oxidoreductase [Curvivirga aplysinae]MTI08895.1 NAD/FAD-binding protein [Curvivirga aplysinae]
MEKKLKIGVVGTGVAGMSAAWLLSQKHDVFVFEKDDRIGGHSNTVDAGDCHVDTGFIVYNEKNYPNLIALFDYLDVETNETDMSFGVSIGQGKFEYSGTDLWGMLAQRRNAFRPKFWQLMFDILKFYRETDQVLVDKSLQVLTLGDYLERNGYSESFIKDHILPMGAAIWSTPMDKMLQYPLESFIRFRDNHGLLQVSDRPKWRTVNGGSKKYVAKITEPYADNIKLNRVIEAVWNDSNKSYIRDRNGQVEEFDHVVLATHGDQTAQILPDEYRAEQRIFKQFQYQPNIAHLHTDESLMPKTKRAWSSWNYLRETIDEEENVCVTYWMNRLQNLVTDKNYFVTLNPTRMPREGSVIRSFLYHHPVFDRNAISAQKLLWNLQGTKRIWYCGSYFGYGFHEDALQSGLAVAEQLGGLKRPWNVPDESGRIHLFPNMPNLDEKDAA